jgi:tetratricopeptide (TPR) repeat protein
MRGCVLAMLVTMSVSSVFAQQWHWPDNPKNLKVLPPTTTGKELQRTMFGYTSGLGVKCLFCHAGQEGQEFSQIDFASDANPEKEEARTMITMVNAINAKYLAGMNNGKGASLSVSCLTCHRGNTQPILLEERLKQTFDATGIDSTIRQYRALREQYYGGFTYNFKEGTLLRLADKIMEDTTKSAAAIQIVKLNIEMYPAFAFSYVHLASYYEDAGNIPEAIENYRQAIKLNPRDERLKKQLERLEAKK